MEFNQKLDELFNSAKNYSKSGEYRKMLEFMQQMRHLGPFNAELAAIQRPGAQFILPANEWKWRYHRLIKDNATPIVILMPFGPVEFLFDLSDTYPENPQLIEENESELLSVLLHFEPRTKVPESLINRLVSNLPMYGIAMQTIRSGAAQAACITQPREPHKIAFKCQKQEYEIDAYYLISVSSNLSESGVFSAICHELGHLLCHHIPAPDRKKWKVRNVSGDAMEFEAESVAKIVCDHFEIDSSFAYKYLSTYMEHHDYIPAGVSPDRIIIAANEIINMLQTKVKLNKSLIYDCNPYVRKIVDETPKKSKKLEKIRNMNNNNGTLNFR